jgi:hypothetical protein
MNMMEQGQILECEAGSIVEMGATVNNQITQIRQVNI